MKKRKEGSLNFEAMIKDGENPLGFTAQTNNGPAHWNGTGWNDQYTYDRPQCEPNETRPTGRSNRTGE